MAMVCETCGGTKFCEPCDGRGEFDDMGAGDVFACEVCDGDGMCVECDGTGEVEDPDQAEFECEEMEVSE
jgi:hypothetical protein